MNFLSDGNALEVQVLSLLMDQVVTFGVWTTSIVRKLEVGQGQSTQVRRSSFLEVLVDAFKSNDQERVLFRSTTQSMVVLKRGCHVNCLHKHGDPFSLMVSMSPCPQVAGVFLLWIKRERYQQTPKHAVRSKAKACGENYPIRCSSSKEVPFEVTK